MRIVRIKNTLSLDELSVSEPLAVTLGDRDDLMIIGEPEAIEFDGAGNLIG